MFTNYLTDHLDTLDELLSWIAEGTSSRAGHDFFESLVEHLALALQVRCAFVGQCLDEERINVQTLACWLNGEFEKGVQYRVLETPCETVIREGKISFYPRQVQTYFPNNFILKRRKAESYLGIPLLNSGGEVIGHLVILDAKPIEDMPSYLAIMKIFAARASAELERLLADQEVLEHTRHLEALYDLDQAILKADSVDTIITLTLDCVKNLVNADRVSVSLYDFKSGEAIVTPPVINNDGRPEPKRIPLAWLNPESVDMQGDEYRLVPDIQEGPFKREIDRKLADMGIRSYITTAMVAPTGRVGALNVASIKPNAFTKLHVDVLREAASHVALAINNLQLLEAERAERVRAQTLQTELEASLSELRRAQANLQRSARLSAAGELAAGVAHQINNPLTTIIGQCFILVDELSGDSSAANSARLIQIAANKAGEVVQRLLDLARNTDYDLQPLDVNQTITDSVNLIRVQLESQCKVIVKLAEPLPHIWGSKPHLGDVWMNLMLNARDALRDYKRATLKVTSRYDDQRRVISVTVEDNGPGITAETQQRIFDPFFTTKPGGTGLGLWIAREVVNQHEGAFEIRSCPGKTVFTVSLPVIEDST